MSPSLFPLRELTFGTMLLRLCLAMLFGAFIGMERERKRRPAGFRTYMLVCIGATTTMLISQYLHTMLETTWTDINYTVDSSRLSAQVINGIGFLGTGTVLITGRQEVKGLTTAAGLWASACMGIAIGAGFYECVIPGCVIMLLSIRFFPQLEKGFIANGKNMCLYVEFNTMRDFGALLQWFHSQNYTILDVDLAHIGETSARPNVVITFSLPHKELHTEILRRLSKLDNISVLEEV